MRTLAAFAYLAEPAFSHREPLRHVLELLPKMAGGVPSRMWTTTPGGRVSRKGRFDADKALSIVDDESVGALAVSGVRGHDRVFEWSIYV